MSSPYRTTTDRRSNLLTRATYAAGALTAGVAVITGLLITKVAQSQAATTSNSSGNGTAAQNNNNGFSQPGDNFDQGGFVGGGQDLGSSGGSHGS